jgi:hypothetical protein
MKNLLAAAVLIAVVPAGSGELRSFASEPAPAPAAEVAPAPAPGETNDQTLPPSSEGSVEVPEPRILVLDRQALLLKSLVGKSIAAQENELELQQSSSEPSADAREKQIQQAVRQARDRVSAALGPILQ